ncbi:TadE family type IV pilus minor pilin [Streptomyces sp. NPDC090109]|uniref:TadE family type IV pilus minor pilin n=1 Tax=Streptomyces sp. NPDC090109 TaxID=3365948 RepID=UPI0037F1E581
MRRSDRGFATVEAAMVLPVLALFTVTLLWALAASAAQIRCVDAARAGARAAARSEPVAAAEAAARTTAPEGARVSVTRSGELWRVTVEAVAPGPRGLGLTLRADAAALAEDTGLLAEGGAATGALGIGDAEGGELGVGDSGPSGSGNGELGSVDSDPSRSGGAGSGASGTGGRDSGPSGLGSPP